MLAQGAITAIVISYASFFYAMVVYARGYDYLFAVFMPIVFGYAAIFGTVIAFAMWIVTELVGRSLRRLVRIIIATLVTAAIYRVLDVSFGGVSFWDAVQSGMFTLFFVLAMGLMTGSRLRPGRALTQGLKPLTNQSRLATVIGFGFRSLTVFGLMESGFSTFYILARFNEAQDFTRYLIIALVALTYFVSNTCFAFGSRDSSVLLTLALMFNGACVFGLVRYWHDLAYASYLIVAYLSLWFTFLLTHLPNGNRVLASLKDELRYYYLID